MSDLSFSIGMRFNPEVNPQKLAEMLNVIIKEMKTKLGVLGKSLDLVDGDVMAKELEKVRAKYEQVASNTKKTGTETDRLVTSLKGATSQAGLLGKAFQFNQVSQSISAITGAIAPFINEFVEFDKQIKNIGTLGVKDFEAFNASLSDLAARIPGTAADMANATYQAISAGVSGSVEEVTNFVEVAAKAGVAGMSDTSTAVDGLTSVINAYGLKVSDVGNVASTFFSGIKLGKTSFNEMVSSIASFVPSASALGVGFDQATAAIARYTALGTPTAQVGTQMNAVFTLLAKGTSPLNKALANVGTDLDTLRNKLKQPVEEGGGLVNVMRDIKVAADASGVQLAALTGRVEAAKIIESLAGSQEKYTASLRVFNNVLGEIDNNAAEQAFQVAATSIAAQTDGLLATVQGYFNSAFQSMGSGATTTLATLTQLSPAITGMAGLVTLGGDAFTSMGKSMVGVATSGSEMVRSILGKYIPALGAKNTADGAAAVSTTALGRAFQSMWSSALLPVAAVVAAIALVTYGVIELYDWLNVTTEEKLESARADEEMIAGQQKVNQADQDAIKSKQALIAQYERLSNKTDLTAEEQSRLSDTIAQLNEVYPGAISSTKTFEDNLKALNEASAEDVTKLQELQNEMSNLEEKAKVATIKRVELETEVSAEGLQENLLDEIDNFIGVNSQSQIKAVDDYVNSIKDAANPEEAQRALLAFNTALWNNPMFEEIPPETRQALSKQASDLTETRARELEEKASQANERISKALNSFAESGVTDFSQLTEEQQLQITADLKDAGKTEDEVRKMMDDAAKVVRDKNLGELISESTKVNGKIKGAESLDELVEQFKNADNEIQKAALGERIKNIAPEAVQSTGVIKSANGELITTYQVLDEKITESAEKQKELNSAKLSENQDKYIESIVEEGNKYKENQDKLDSLQKQISEKVKLGADSSDLRKEYQALSSENDAYINDIGNMAIQWKNAGLSTEQIMQNIAESTGKPINEVEDLIVQIEKTTEALKETEEAAKTMGEAFTEELNAAKNEFENNLPELAARLKALNEAKASGNKQAIKDAETAYKTQLETTKLANAEFKSYADTEKRIKEMFETKKKQVKVVSEYEKASKELKNQESILKLAQDEFQIHQDLQIAAEGRKRTTEDDLLLKQRALETAKLEKQAAIDLYKIVENADGTIDIGIKVKEEERRDIEKQVKELGNNITKSEIAVVQLNSTLNIEEKELQKKVLEHERKNLEYQIELGLKPRFDLVGALENDLVKVAKEIEDKSTKVKALNELKIAGTITQQQKAELKKLETELIESESKQIEIKKSIRSEYSTIYDEELNELKSKHDRELTEVESRLEEEARLRDLIVTTTSNIATSDIDREYDRRISKLELLKEAEIISEEVFNRRKEDLELEHQKKLQVIQEQSTGAQLEAQRQADLQKLEQSRSQLIAELEIERERAVKLKDDKRLKELEASLGTIEGQIAEKGDIITSLATNLQGNITEIFSSITGNEEQMKEPWRKAFSVVAGALKQLASSAITSMILGQLKINAAAGGLAGLLLVPAITGIVNAGVNSIMNPILSSLLSFSTGGRVDEPTLAVVGDAGLARPGSNTEWIFRDDQLRLIMRQVVNEFKNDLYDLVEDRGSREKVDIKELNKSIVSQTMYEFSKHNVNETSEVYNRLLENIEEKDYNLMRLFNNIIQETKFTSKDMLNEVKFENIFNHIQKEFTIDRQIEHIRNTFVEGVYEVSKGLSSLKQVFKENTFNFENFNDFIQSHNKLKRTQNEYISNRLAVPDFQDIKTQTLLKVNSYATGSPFLNTPELAIIGDAGKKNPEVVLNSPQLEEIMRRATSSSNEMLSKKLDEVINAINGLDLSIEDESIIKTINRKAQENRKRTRVN